MFDLFFSTIACVLDIDERSGNNTGSSEYDKVTLQMYEIHNEKLRDLLQPGESSSGSHLSIETSVQKGKYIKVYHTKLNLS